jgi:hypothetical protein
MNNEPLTIQQAAILMEHSKTEVREAIRDQRWPSFVDESGRSLISPSVLAQHWANDLTDPLTAPQTRDRLTDLAEAADYPLDLDALQRDAVRHLRIEHALEDGGLGVRRCRAVSRDG